MDPTTAIDTFLAALARDNPDIDWAEHHERLQTELHPYQERSRFVLRGTFEFAERLPFFILPVEIAVLSWLHTVDLTLTCLKTVPEEIVWLTQLERLYLRISKLTVIPESIVRLRQLKVLSLRENILISVPEDLGQLVKLQRLDLSYNKLASMQDSIMHLVQLQRLDLRGNVLTTIPNTLGQLTQLQDLDLSENKLISIPREVDNLTQLKYLALSHNALTDLPNEIGGLTYLQGLDLRANHLTKVPNTLGYLTQLKELYLSDNTLKIIPDSLGQLKKLTKLYLSHNALTTVPESLGHLVALEWLDLSHNQLTEVPDSLGQLTQLQSLSLSHNQLTEVPDSLGQLTQLQSLSLSHNQLTEMPDALGRLTQLMMLNLDMNALRVVPEWLGQLRDLERLYLAGNQLTTVPESLEQLAKLEGLSLSNNPLASLPEWMCQLPQLTMLDLRETQIPLPPELVEDRLAQDILDYYFRPARPLHEAKVVLVGEGGVGKTSLVRRLLDDAFVAGEAKTEGIAIRDWQPPGSPLTLHLWDFGGQELMHATHQFFLTERTLYVLVLNGRFNEIHNRLDYWLKLIESVSAEAPVLVVQNYADEHTQPLDERGLRRRYPSIVGFHTTSCKTRQGILALHTALLEEVARLPHVNDRIPEAWFAVKAQLQATQRDYLNFERYIDLCEAEDITYAWEQQRLIRFLHDLGTVLCFADDPRLMDTTVLNPRWVTEGIYRLLNTPALQAAGGVLDCQRLNTLLDPKAYPRNTGHFLLDMLRKFELCFDLPHTNGQQVLIPDLLPVEEPELGDWTGTLAFDYHYDVLPGSIMVRFIVRLHTLLDHTRLWRHGAVLHDRESNNTALVQADPEARRIRVRVGGPEGGRRRLLALIRGEFRAIHRSFAALAVTEQVPITATISVSYSHLLKLESKGASEVWPDGADDPVPLGALLDGISDPAERRLQRIPGYEAIRDALKAINQEGWLYLDIPALQPLQQRLQSRLAHLESQIALKDASAIAFELLYERDQLIKQLTAMDQLLTFKRSG